MSNILRLWPGQEAHDIGSHVPLRHQTTQRALQPASTSAPIYISGIFFPSHQVSSLSPLYSVTTLINPTSTIFPTLSVMTVVVNPCTCLHAEHSHYLIRCGCANDRGPKHPMHQMDDAFHRVWCSECLIYCYHPPSCPGLHSTTCVNYLNATLRGLQTSLRVFLSCELHP